MEVKIGDIFEGKIIDFTHDGKGVLKLDKLIVFINGTLIGDEVTIQIEEVKKKFAIGKLIKINQPSEDRIKLDFNVEESRGGIPLIEYRYIKQLEWKKSKVNRDIEKIAGIKDIKINDTIGMMEPFRYRNHVQIPVGQKNGKTTIGFYESNSKSIVDMNGSILQPKIGDKIIKIVREWMNKYNIKSYDEKTKKGIVRHLGIRINRDNKAMVIIVTGSKILPNKRELIELLKNENIISIYQNINQLRWSTYGKDYFKIYGEDKLLDYIGDYKFYLSPKSFFQINRIQTEKLYEKAIEYLDPTKEDIIYDLYCGIGTISSYVANKVKKVYGIELLEEAIEDAKENALLNNVSNTEFIVGKAEEVFPNLAREGIKGNKIVLDPPRRGCDKEVLEGIIKMNPERVVYVSCNSTTMARDVKYLVENGYMLSEVQPVDMFPHTAHIECVVGIQKIQ